MATLNISGLYEAAEKARLKSLTTATKQSKSRLTGTLSSIQSNYTKGVTQAQTGARITALGNEEKLAASGLSFGAAGQAATTGYTETSRIQDNNNLRTNLGTLAQRKATDEQAARSATSEEIARATEQAYQDVADIRAQSAKAKVDQYNADRSYANTQSAAAYQKALQRWQTYGYVLPADAKVLGVRAGTKTSTVQYNDARLALERWKALRK